MKYGDEDPESKNVEDRRGQGGGFRFPGGGGRQIPIRVGGRGGLSIWTILIILAVMWILGINPLDLLRGGPGGQGGFPDIPGMPGSEPGGRPTADQSPFDIPGLPGGGAGAVPQAEEDMKRFVGKVLQDTEDVWNRKFASWGREYEEPRLVIFRGGTQTACGTGVSAMGPFYCPLDKKIYVDLAFYDQLKRKLDAPGDFAQAYVIAHEVGHHVQTLLGIAQKVQEAKSRMGEGAEANALQVRMELQADCLAGAWAKLADAGKNRLEAGDIEEGLNAANQIGDDMLQKKTQGHVVPDSFTHGTSAQRVEWFKRGFEAGDVQACDTFKARI